MNKKVDEKFTGIEDIYQLQCLCTELNDEIKRLNKRNEILSKELTKDKILHQDRLTTCCGIPIEEIPDLINKVDILQKENTRLGKSLYQKGRIIEELEKFMKMQQELYRAILSKRPENDEEHNVYYSTLAGNEQLSIILDKLEELKVESFRKELKIEPYTVEDNMKIGDTFIVGGE